MANDNLTPRDTLIRAGETAPDFELPTQTSGKTWKLSDALKGGEVILSFFPFAFTGVCGTEMACITKDLAQFTAKGATAVGISCDSPFALSAWAQQLGLSHTLLSDAHRKVCKAYGLYWPDMNTTNRGTVVITRDGKVKWSQKREPKNAFNEQELLAQVS